MPPPRIIPTGAARAGAASGISATLATTATIAASASPTDPRPPHRPERWHADSGSRDVVRLDIPADALRERHFEIDCRLVVAARPGASTARHALQVRVDGALEWSREVATHADGSDGLELRFRRTVPAGRPLRLAASCELNAAVRQRLSISAEED